MIIAVLVVLGLCLGSFVNALVWRVHEQDREAGKKKPSQKRLQALSVAKGRSMCPHCRHELKALDLLPVVSWLGLRGRCRYCRERISVQYPLVELATAGSFVASYLLWPVSLSGHHVGAACATVSHHVLLLHNSAFAVWLVLMVGLTALFVYDLKWFLLPNRIVFPLTGIAAIYAALRIAGSTQPGMAALNTLLAVIIGGGIFYVLFHVSQGKWIGGGDVKLGWLLGLLVGTPSRAALFIFMAALLGTVVSLPLLATQRLGRRSLVPFGPFLILGAIITVLFGHAILNWYQGNFIPAG